MRKIICLLLCFIMVFSLTACSGNEKPETQESETPTQHVTLPQVYDEPQDGNDDETIEDALDELNDAIIRYEDIFKDNAELQKTIKELQGKFTSIFNGTSNISFIANNKWYKIDELRQQLEEVAEIPEDATFIQRFDNMEIGENLIVYAGANSGLLKTIEDSGKTAYENIEFNIMRDIIIQDGMNESFHILTPTENGYIAKYYNFDSDRIVKYNSEKAIEKILLADDNELTEAGELVCLLTDTWGFSLFFISENGDVYEIRDVTGNALKTTTVEPIIKNAERVLDELRAPYLTTPMYTKVNDAKAAYAMAYGESLFDKEDDIEITFTLPEAYETAEIKITLTCGHRIIFMFSDNSVYITEEIEQTRTEPYELKKLEAISKMTEANEVLELASVRNAYGAHIYMLNTKGEILAYPVDELN